MQIVGTGGIDMAKGVTLADIAARVGVSNVAESKALSGKLGVSEEMRIRIKQVAEQMGYVSGSTARSAPAATGNIGVIMPEHYYEYSVSFYGFERINRKGREMCPKAGDVSLPFLLP